MSTPKKRATKASKLSVRQPTAVTIRGSKDWRDWLDRGAEFCRTDSSKLVDIAVKVYLESQGFTEAPPKR